MYLCVSDLSCKAYRRRQKKLIFSKDIAFMLQYCPALAHVPGFHLAASGSRCIEQMYILGRLQLVGLQKERRSLVPPQRLQAPGIAPIIRVLVRSQKVCRLISSEHFVEQDIDSVCL